MGSTHDFRLFQLDFDPEQQWRFPVQVLGDLAYTALGKHFEIPQLEVPHKRKRKPKGEPKDELSEEQKVYNRALSSRRIVVEHAIGGMKNFHCLRNVWRGRRFLFDDVVILNCAGLWNALLLSNMC